jgi:O-methyltransferase
MRVNIKQKIARALRIGIANLPVDLIEAGLFRAILRQGFSSLRASKRIADREDVWRYAGDTIGRDRKVLFLEFGVYEGYSIRAFSKIFTNRESRFVGFDSFTGLPQRWGNKQAGTFDTAGILPSVDDERISFVAGWFHDTVPPFSIPPGDFPAVLVHMDADLYSSTLFALTELWRRFPVFFAVFDEFLNHECRALYNFQHAFPSRIEFLAHDYDLPSRVFCKITRVAPQSV